MSLRRRLLLLAFSLLIPAVIACGIAVAVALHYERQRSEVNLLQTSKALAVSLDRELDAVVRRLEALATSPSLQQGDLRAFARQARQAVSDEGMWIVLNAPDGQQLVNTLRPFGEPLPRHAPDHPFSEVLERTLRSGWPVVSDLFVGPVTGKPTLAVSVPVFDATGQPLYGLAMGVEPGALGVIGAARLPASWLAAAYDTRLVIVARSADGEAFVGTRPVEPLADAMAAAASGLVDVRLPDAMQRRVAFSRSPKYGWHFAIGVPRAELASSIYRALLLFLGLALALLTAGAVLALRLGRGISRSITSLVPTAHALRRGQLLVHEPTGIVEVDQVSATLAETSGVLLAAQAELRAAKEQAEHADMAKSQFLASASHDLRQPVQSLFFFHEILASRLRGHPCRPVVANMQAGLDALKTLLDGLLDISRLHAGAVEVHETVFPVSMLLDRLAAENAARAESLGIALRVVPSSAWIRSDLAHLERILRNLLDNALKYTGRGGAVLLGCRRAGPELRIMVADTGLGIPPDKHEAVFEEFVQLGNPERDRSRGLGLGLAIVRHLGRLLRHDIGMRSRPGHGSSFWVAVPMARPRREGRPATAPPLLAAAGNNGLALVVEDEALVLVGLRAMLESWGWQVLAAQSGEEAVRLVTGSARAPDLIIADYRLRGDETGVKVVRDIHGVCALTIPAVVLTGDTSPERIAECRQSGLQVMHKPISADALHAVLDEMKAQKSA